MHKEWVELIPFYIAKRLSSPETQALESHLQRCAACRQAFEEWRMVATVVRSEADIWAKPLPKLSFLPQHGTTKGFNADETQIAASPAYAPTIEVNPKFSAKTRPTRFRSRLAMAAALMMVLFAGLLVILLSKDSPDTRIESLAQAKLTSQASITATVSTRQTFIVGTPFAEQTTIGIGSGGGESDSFPVETQEVTFMSIGCYASSTIDRAVSIYEWPATIHSITDSLALDESRVVLSYTLDGWYELGGKEGGIAGWVLGTQIQLTGDCSQLRLPTPTGNGIGETSNQCFVSTLNGNALALSVGPAESYQQLGDFWGPLEAIGRSDTGWYRVYYLVDGNIWLAWVFDNGLQLSGTCDSLPMYIANGYLDEAQASPTETAMPR